MIDLGAVVQDSPLESRRELPNIVSDASRVRPRCRTETLGKCRCQLGDLAQMGFYRFDPFPVLGDMRYVIGGCVRKMDTLLLEPSIMQSSSRNATKKTLKPRSKCKTEALTR